MVHPTPLYAACPNRSIDPHWSLPDNQLEISFGTIPHISYILKKKFSLNDANWTPVQSIVASSSTTIFAVPITHDPGREFFRLEIAP